MSRGPLSRVVVGAGKTRARQTTRKATRFTEHETNAPRRREGGHRTSRDVCPNHESQPRNTCRWCLG